MADNPPSGISRRPVIKCIICHMQDGLEAVQKDISFYRFPRDRERCRQWATLCNRSDLLNFDPEYCNKTYKVCSQHFDPSDICNGRLATNAIPSLFQVHDSNFGITSAWCLNNVGNQNSYINNIGEMENNEIVPEDSIVTNNNSLEDVNENDYKDVDKNDNEDDDEDEDDDDDDCIVVEHVRNSRKKVERLLKIKKRSKCCVPYCKNNRINIQGVILIKFPNDPYRCSLWIKKIPNFDQSTTPSQAAELRICSLHFKESQFSCLDRTKVFGSVDGPSLFDSNVRSDNGSNSNQGCTLPSHSSLTSTDNSNSSTDLSTESSYSASINSDAIINQAIESIQSPSASLSSDVLSTPELKDDISTETHKYMQLEQIVKKLEELLGESLEKQLAEPTKSTFEMFKNHLLPKFRELLKMNGMKLEGEEYLSVLKKLSLVLHFACPEISNLFKRVMPLRILMLEKPLTETREFNVSPNQYLFDLLSFKFHSFNVDALDCILCADIIPLKTSLYFNITNDQIIGFHDCNFQRKYEPAKYALVFMVKGLNFLWKQPLACFFISSSISSSSDLKSILFSTICKLQNIRLNVKAFVSPLNPSFVSLSNSLFVSPNQPYFEVEGKKIIYIFDPLSLLLCTRNMLFKYDFKINDNTTKVQKKHIFSFFKVQNFRSKSELTPAHFNPQKKEKKDYNLAIQVFSSKVANYMTEALVQGSLPSEAQGTIDFLNDMYKLCDIFYSFRIAKRGNNYSPFKNTLVQTSILEKMTDNFKNMKLFTKNLGPEITAHREFINGWLVNISGLKFLWDSLYLTKDQNYALHTDRINLYCIKSMFNAGNNYNLTPLKFFNKYKKIFERCYLSRPSSAFEPPNDYDHILLQTNGLVTIFNRDIIETPATILPSVKLGTLDYRHAYIPEINKLFYIAGYLMKMCLVKHKCQICIDYIRAQTQVCLSFFENIFEYNSPSENCVNSSSQAFFDYIKELENIFIVTFPQSAFKNSLVTQLINEFNNVPFDHPCGNFDKLYLLHFFARLRIYISVTYLNKSLLLEPILRRRQLATLQNLANQ